MNITTILADFFEKQKSFFILILLQLTGWLFPTPALLRNGDSFDYIIIGGGTAGSVIATRLAQKEYNILLIEAGPDAPYETTFPGLMAFPLNSHVDWNYTAVDSCYQCQRDHELKLNTGRMLGGSGGLNHMVYSRGNPEAFKQLYEITGDPTWKYDNILSYFIKAENVSDSAIDKSEFKNRFGSKGYIGVTRDNGETTDQILESFRQVGENIIVDIDGNRNGYSRGLLTIADGTRQNAGPRYLSNIVKNEYIAVAKATIATKIIFDDDKNAVGVEVITNEGKKVVVNARKEIVIACGAIKSPQLLMLSGIGPATELERFNMTTISDLPVGKELRDIIGVFIAHTINKKTSNMEKNPRNFPAEIFVGYGSLYSSINLDEPSPDFTVLGYIIDNIPFLGQFCSIINNFNNDICNKLIDKASDNQVVISLIGNLYSKSLGQVTLRSTDPEDSPHVIPVGFSFDGDLDALVDYIKYYLQVEKTDAYKKSGATRLDLTSPHCDEFEKNSREYWRCYILCMMVNFKSYSGTCALNSVVDSRLMVRGVNNLRVADTSVLPISVGGMTYNTALMIGEKASDMIIEDAGDEYNSMEHEKIGTDQLQNLPDDNILV